MKDEQNRNDRFKQNERYFTSATLGRMSTICWGAAAVGAVIVFLRISFWTYLLGGTIALVAVICGIVFNVHSMSDSDYKVVCNAPIVDFRKRYLEYVNLQLNKASPRNKAPISVDEDAVLFSNCFLYENTLNRIGQDGVSRSGKLSITAEWTNGKTLYAAYEIFNLLTGEQEERFCAVPLTKLESFTAEEIENPHSHAEYRTVRIRLREQEDEICYPRMYDAELSKLMDRTMALAKSAQAAEN